MQGFDAYKGLGELDCSTPTSIFVGISELSKMRNFASYMVFLASQLGFVAAASLTDVATVGYATLNGGLVLRHRILKDESKSVQNFRRERRRYSHRVEPRSPRERRRW